jgi:hydroxypyruvate reductase
MADVAVAEAVTHRPLHIIAIGKAAAAMATAFASVPGLDIRRTLAIGTHPHDAFPSTAEWIESSHPFPDSRSERAAIRALEFAGAVKRNEVMVVLLSGGASALICAPIEGLTLTDKIATTRTLMEEGADIHALNAVRRHMSRIKGGRLATVCPGTTVTLAISDVIGDDLNAIGSGPAVPDASTWTDAADALDRFGGLAAYSESVRRVVQQGLKGEVPDTPKPGDVVFEGSLARVIGSRAQAIEGAREAARERGYYPVVIADPVKGTARDVALDWWARVEMLVASAPKPACVISGGETTVRVTGPGTGGRNLEFALALAPAVARATGQVVGASIGTDGIDGTSGVAGGLVDSTTMSRAKNQGLETPARYLDANNSFAFFSALDDCVRLGRTDTNVGDLQIFLFES